MPASYTVADLGKYSLDHVWSALDSASTNVSAVTCFGYTDKSVEVTGTWGAGGTVVIEGSNHPTAPTTYVTLTDHGGTNLSFTSNGLKVVLQNVVWIRPRVTGGDGSTNLTVRILATTVARG